MCEDDDESRQRTVAEETQHARTNGESEAIAQYFGVPGSEFERWPERWQRALKRVHVSPEKFRKRTAHTLKMFDASDWVLVEKMAPYALGGHLLAACYLWRAVDHEGEVLEVVATNRRDLYIRYPLSLR